MDTNPGKINSKKVAKRSIVHKLILFNLLFIIILILTIIFQHKKIERLSTELSNIQNSQTIKYDSNNPTYNPTTNDRLFYINETSMLDPHLAFGERHFVNFKCKSDNNTSSFKCLDDSVELVREKCAMLSIGVGNDILFDYDIVERYVCEVHSFDPIVEADVFKQARTRNSNNDSVIVPVVSKWNFYRAGLSPNVSMFVSNESLKCGDYLNMSDILGLTQLKNRTVDVVKINLNETEKESLKNLDMDYACLFFKVILVRTSFDVINGELSHLNKCFYLYNRETKFLISDYVPIEALNDNNYYNNTGNFTANPRISNRNNSKIHINMMNREFYFINVYLAL